MPSVVAAIASRLRSVSRLLFALTLIACLAGCGGARSGSVHPSRSNLSSIFEAEPQLHANPPATIAKLERLGAEQIRVYIAWNALAALPKSTAAPSLNASDPAAYPQAAWAIYDEIVRAATQQRMGVLLTLGGPPPLWAAGPGAPRGGQFPQWRPSAAAYGEFVRAVATRYDGTYRPPGSPAALPRVSFWSIWNEPNYGPELAPQAIDNSTVEVAPQLYRNMLDAAWSALSATGHGGDTILIGESAPRGLTTGNNPGNFSGMVPLRFLRALYCVDGDFRHLRGEAAVLRGCPATSASSNQFKAQHPALFDAAGFAAHLYPQGLPPNVVIPDEPDYADIATVGNLERTLDRAQRAYGSDRVLPIWNTEFGYQTDPPEKIARTVDPKTAAAYLNWSEYMSWRDPRIRSYDQYQLTDPPSAGAAGGFATGLEFKDGTPKASFKAFRLPLFLPRTTAPRGTALEVWGCVRPGPLAARQTGQQQSAQIQFAPGGRPPFRTLRSVSIADPHGYFDTTMTFPSSGTVRLAWSYPGGPMIHSREVTVSIR